MVQPISYNTFNVGPIEVKVHLRPDESVEDAVAYWSPKLKAMCDEQATVKFKQWRAHYLAAQKSV